MKQLLLFCALLLTGSTVAQAQIDENTYDFWVGDWSLTWTDANGNTGKGKNNIIRILDGKVIQENFEALEGRLAGYKGTSISVFNPNSKTWHQTWQDNQGGNLVFTGAVEGDRKFFQTPMRDINGQKVQSRMVFYDFTDDGFTWDWERTQDGGNTWQLNWRINYRKTK